MDLTQTSWPEIACFTGYGRDANTAVKSLTDEIRYHIELNNFYLLTQSLSVVHDPDSARHDQRWEAHSLVTFCKVGAGEAVINIDRDADLQPDAEEESERFEPEQRQYQDPSD